MNHKGKAAILTWCYNNGKTNYGQILQCYAMQEVIRKRGYDPLVVRYRRPDPKEEVFGLSAEDRLRYERDYRVHVVEDGDSLRVRRFMEFIQERISLTEQCYTVSEVEDVTKDCDLLVCGSDQIWNPLWFDEVYCLGFGRPEQRRVAYAPSGVLDEARQESVETYRKIAQKVSDFEMVTVREAKSVSILERYTSKEVTEAIDPTMLLTSEEWNRVAGNRVYEGKYVFCYALGRMRAHKPLMRYLMKKYQAEKVLFLTSGHYEEENELETEGVFCAVDDAGPAEFLSLIRGAETVCTDSFHGIALSVIYEKQFYIVQRNDPDIELWGSMERQKNLMRKVNIPGDRMIRSVKDVDEMTDIRYEDVIVDREADCLQKI